MAGGPRASPGFGPAQHGRRITIFAKDWPGPTCRRISVFAAARQDPEDLTTLISLQFGPNHFGWRIFICSQRSSSRSSVVLLSFFPLPHIASTINTPTAPAPQSPSAAQSQPNPSANPHQHHRGAAHSQRSPTNNYPSSPTTQASCSEPPHSTHPSSPTTQASCSEPPHSTHPSSPIAQRNNNPSSATPTPTHNRQAQSQVVSERKRQQG